MDTETTPTPPPTNSRSSFFRSPLHLLILLFILASLVAVLVVAFKLRDDKTSQLAPPNTPVGTNATLFFSPANQNVKAGETLTVAIWEDSGNQEVNAVQAKINYQSDKFELVGIKADGSAFEIQAESSNTTGEIIIARGHVGKLTGRQLVATLEFRAKESTGTAQLSFANESYLVSASDNKDILSSRQEGVYTLELNQ